MLNTTTFCNNKGFEFIFPLNKVGAPQSEVSYLFDFCVHFFTEQFIPIGGTYRRTFGAILPSFYNLRARFIGSGPEHYNATAFQEEAYFNFDHPGLKVYAFEYERVTAPDFEFDPFPVFHTMSIEDLNLG